MVPSGIVSPGRGRKRRRKDVDQQRGSQPKRRTVEARGEGMVGRYVLKLFGNSGVFLGKVADYGSELYRVDYEDGDYEDLDQHELSQILVGEEYFDDDLMQRRKKLDALVMKKREKLSNLGGKGEELPSSIVDEVLPVTDLVLGEDKSRVAVQTGSQLLDGEANGSEVNDDGDSSSDLSESVNGCDAGLESELPAIPPPELPPSSRTVGVPEECVPNLFSVYGFLRSFSVSMFLAPFTLDDLVGCLNCPLPSSLLDAIHVALLRTVGRHLEALRSDGSELASKCLRFIDWALLDSLTWPVYLGHYLMLMRYSDGDEWKRFYDHILEKDYCTLSVGKKLKVLQILCDDALESAEVREEFDIRVETEVGIDTDGFASALPETGPRRVHPRFLKTVARKSNEAVDIHPESNGSIPSKSNSMDLRGIQDSGGDAVVGEDGNGDECRLCGMDGTLLCCDGCPSAYHSRCIGVNKMYIPEGPWFCPECTVDKVGPTIAVGTALRGAELFGSDLYEQVFLGTCNHLLVLKVSVNTCPFVRYYSCNDIPKVLKVLHSPEQHSVIYTAISQAILKYWGMPQAVLTPETVLKNVYTQNMDDQVPPTTVCRQNGCQITYKKLLAEELANSGECTIDNIPGSLFMVHDTGKPGLDDISFVELKNSDLFSGLQSGPDINAKLSEQNVADFQGVSLSGLTHESLGVGSTLAEDAVGTSGYYDMSIGGKRNGVYYPVHGPNCGKGVQEVGVGDQNLSHSCFYLGSSFKPHVYVNHYVHGDFAASSAANLAVLSSEENRVSQVNASDNPRKFMSACVSLQAKAFSLTAPRFLWPNPEKKLIEVPRERCSWCLNCKASSNSKKACLLNAAALNATRGVMKIISKLSLTKNVENRLYGIAMYMIYMEDALHGLVDGPFRDAGHRQKWRKQVEQIPTCSEMKSLLLDFEKNVRTITLSGEWVKQVDYLMGESSGAQSTCPPASTQRRGPGRPKKHLRTSEIPADEKHEDSTDFVWWRGGKLAKLVFHKAMLSQMLLRKAARQGGSKMVSGIHYTEGSDVPKRSRQLIWRVAVEMSKNISQLALQIRYLDHHIRWNDLAPPEQSQDSKGPETEASAFRNACIRDKKHVNNKLLYGVTFMHQRHLPSRLMKSIIEKEETQDGKEKYWFLEARVPLYLIREYERTAAASALPPIKTPSGTLSKLQKRQLKASRKDVFLYLVRKRDNLRICYCASCNQVVFLSNAVKCSTCEGYCHRECTMSSIIQTTEDADLIITCKHCYQGKALLQNQSSAESPTSPLVMQGHENQKPFTVCRSTVEKNYQLTSVRTSESLSEMKTAAPDSSVTSKTRKRSTTWGLIWKKKNIEDTGAKFRLNHILWRDDPNNLGVAPICHLCHKLFNPNLIYIRCEACQDWYHAEAVELDESKAVDLMGFKCCRCRRIKSPLCPYADIDRKKAEVKKSRIKVSKPMKVELDSVSGATESSIPSTPITPMEDDVFIQFDDPILFSEPSLEPISEQKTKVDFEWDTLSSVGPQKLPVRRYLKHNSDGFSGINGTQVELSSTQNLISPADDVTSHNLEWDVSSGLENEMTVDYESFNLGDVDFEPQTYFSMGELLDPDDVVQPEEDDEESIPSNWGYWTSSNTGTVFEDGYELDTSTALIRPHEQHEVGASSELMEPVPLVEIVPCGRCSHAEPAPDLSCQNCGLQIHSHCSPWEDLPEDEIWKCGNCRAWK